jgi:hypothetical protein
LQLNNPVRRIPFKMFLFAVWLCAARLDAIVNIAFASVVE